jgi:hypothetical protein
MMKTKDFIQKLMCIVTSFKTVYMWGVFGAPVTEYLIATKSKQYPEWYNAKRQAAFRKLIGKGYFGFDCVNTIKGILWGWNGNPLKGHGGGVYASNGVPDVSADGMLTKLTGVSTDFSNIVEGEAVWTKGHIGVYIGNGKVIECTPSWKNNVQMTACLNVGPIIGMNGRRWLKHGKLPYIEYEAPAPPLRTYTIRQGDSLWSIADKLLKNGERHGELMKLNKLDSNVLKIGQVLKIPSK